MDGRLNRAIVAAVAMIVGAAVLSPARLQAEPIRIGAILALSGNSAANGQSMRDGLQLAVDEINKRGGVNGNRLELLVEDSKTDPGTAVEAFNRLEASRKPLFYLSFLSAVGLALAPVAEAKGVVLVGLVTTHLDLTRGRQWVFRYYPLGPAYMPPITRMLQDLKVQRLGILFQSDAYGIEQQQLMSKSFADAGGSVLVRSVALTDTDLRAPVAELLDQQAVYVAASGSMLQRGIQQLKDGGYRGHIVAGSGAADPRLFSQPFMDGVFVAAPIIHNPSYLYAREAGSLFAARYGRSIDLWAANGYDFVKLISGLLEDRKISRQSVRDLLLGGFRFSGVFGQVSVKAGEHDLTFPIYATQVSGGTLKYR